MTDDVSTEDIVSHVRRGDKRVAARLMSLVEQAVPESEECLRKLRHGAGRAHTIGVTGWPGVGKSTLIAGMARSFLDKGRDVGVIAVDPTSPVSGGSLLGDRERMRMIDGHERLFIRSMATRGCPGGIASSTDAFIRIMEAMGKDVIIVETVGVGQDQVSVSHVVDTVVMTVIPGMGDYVQALKAGIMELGDIFVVNKSDRKGVEEVVMDLEMIICMNERTNEWRPPVVKAIAKDDEGIEELIGEIERHRQHCARCGLVSSKRMAAAKIEIMETLKTRFFELMNERTGFEKTLERYAQQVIEGTIDRYTLAESIFRETGIVT
jgi:LAO/AO transport system kinase